MKRVGGWIQPPTSLQPPTHIDLQPSEWCPVRMRFSAEDVALLRGAEAVQGALLGREPDASALRDALILMKAGRKLGAAHDGGTVTLAEAETAALAAAMRASLEQVKRYHERILGWRSREPLAPEQVVVVEQAFPFARGSAWETSRLIRALQALAARLEAPPSPS
ncbi:MAG: hypothetical protein HY690_12155 [Chloroflexi bacterium]|nr:hypothetical protein [Chloroflexota bacterium]